MPLPNDDLSGSIGKRARYTDAVGFSKSLLGMLVDDGRKVAGAREHWLLVGAL